MQQLKEQINNLLNNTISKKDAEEFLEIKQKELDDHFKLQEWDEFMGDNLPAEVSKAMFKKIMALKEPVVRTMLWKAWLSIAAMPVIVFSLTIHYAKPTKTQDGIVAIKAIKRLPFFKQYVITNIEKSVKKIKTPDGSTIALSPGSTIRFTDPMEAGRRSIFLDGEAVFYVKKNPLKPFTVYSLGISTTALGTVFKVSSPKNNPWAHVHLISGKIVVRSIKDSTDKLFLVAGEQCTFNQQSEKLKMQMGLTKPPITPTSPKDYQVIKEKNKIYFNNTPLPLVLEQLDSIYRTKIIFSVATLNKIRFTGACKKSGTLHNILETIILLNNLEFKMVADTIYLTQK